LDTLFKKTLYKTTNLFGKYIFGIFNLKIIDLSGEGHISKVVIKRKRFSPKRKVK